MRAKNSFGREAEQDKILHGMRISPRAKMKWLREMNEFMLKAASKKTMKIRQKLRKLGAR